MRIRARQPISNPTPWPTGFVQHDMPNVAVFSVVTDTEESALTAAARATTSAGFSEGGDAITRLVIPEEMLCGGSSNAAR